MNVVTIGDGLMARAIAREMPVTILGHDVIDCTSSDSIVNAFRSLPFNIDVAIYCAAKHQLAWCEKNADETFNVNARGVERVARLVPTVYVSSDYVFSDGGPHTETMPGRQPRSVYGRSKLAGELATLENDGIVVRVSGLYDHFLKSHKGPSFPELVATTFDNLRYPNDQVFSPTYAPDAAQRIKQIVTGETPELSFADGPPQGIYHAANAGSTSWEGLASETLRVLGRRYRTRVVGYEAKDKLRPTNSALTSTRLPPLPNWLDGLQRWADNRVVQTVSPLRD